MKKGVKKIGLLAIRTYFKIRSLYPVWRMLNSQAIRTLTLPHLNAVQERVVGDLRKKGIATAHITELFDDSVFATLVSDFTQLRDEQKKKQKTTKSFFSWFYEFPLVIHHEDNFIKFILDPKIVTIVNAYLGMQSKFYCALLNVTKPLKKGEKPKKSQRWHRDPEDKKMCKVFLYLNDVDQTSGPFRYVTHSAYGMKYGRLSPQQPPIGYYPTNGKVKKEVDREFIHTLTGVKGTLLFADTAGLHKGGYATAKERIMLTAGFLSPRSVTNARITSPKSSCYQLMPGPKMRFSRKLFRFHQRWSESLGKDPYNE